MDRDERRERAWEAESAEEFLNRVQVLVTEEADPLRRSQNLQDLRLAYETRAQFFVELEDHLGEGTIGKQVAMPERADLEQLLSDVTDEYVSAESTDPSFISLDILNQLDEEG
jgi:hypothetical protein